MASRRERPPLAGEAAVRRMTSWGPLPPLANSTGVGAIEPLTAKEFALFQALIHQEAGIYLNETKQPLLASRLQSRLRALGLTSFGAYYRHLVEGHEDERVEMLNRISTNETRFFREIDQFKFLERDIFPSWIDRAASGDMKREIRVWSAGCSTGQEPYSLAMTLLTHFPQHEGWKVRILATDISTRVLEQAQAGVWPRKAAEQIPLNYLKRFMLKGTRSQDGKMKAGPEIRSIVSFQRLNLNDDHYRVWGPFELMFCRNVLIYFNKESRQHVIERLLDELAPTGYFFLGRSETLICSTERVRIVSPSVYVHGQKKGER